jgi:[protein-PII] uridylyltransferase
VKEAGVLVGVSGRQLETFQLFSEPFPSLPRVASKPVACIILGQPWHASGMKRPQTRPPLLSQQTIAKNVTGVSADEITAHFNQLPERYFTQTDEAEVALHIEMVNRLLHNISTADSLGTLRPVIEWREVSAHGCSAVHVVTWDRAGLFYTLAGALSVAGLNILAARISTRNDHIAIDGFEVVGPDHGPVRDPRAQEIFAKAVEDALVSGRDLSGAIQNQAARYAGTAAPAVPPSVDAYLEITSPRAIVEIHAADRFGLLYRVGRIIAEHGFNLSAAKVHTERGLAIDRFHLEPADKRPLDVERLTVLRQALHAAITRPAA